MKSFEEFKKAFEGKPIDWKDYEQLAKDCWLFLTNGNLPARANIKKEAFLHEVKVMIENAVLFNQPKPSPTEIGNEKEFHVIIRKEERVNSLLSHCLRFLDEEQMIVLKDCLIKRTPPTEIGQQGDLVKKIEFWTKRYEFSFQFWGEGQNNVYINKDFVEVASFGGYKTMESVLNKVINWCEKSNPRIKYD